MGFSRGRSWSTATIGRDGNFGPNSYRKDFDEPRSNLEPEAIQPGSYTVAGSDGYSRRPFAGHSALLPPWPDEYHPATTTKNSKVISTERRNEALRSIEQALSGSTFEGDLDIIVRKGKVVSVKTPDAASRTFETYQAKDQALKTKVTWYAHGEAYLDIARNPASLTARHCLQQRPMPTTELATAPPWLCDAGAANFEALVEAGKRAGRVNGEHEEASGKHRVSAKSESYYSSLAHRHASKSGIKRKAIEALVCEPVNEYDDDVTLQVLEKEKVLRWQVPDASRP